MSKKFPISDSTRAFFKEYRKNPDMTFMQFLHGYIYGRWPYFYIGMGIGEHPLAQRIMPILEKLEAAMRPVGGDGVSTKVPFEDTYHGKVLPLDHAKKLISVKRDIHLPDLGEKVVPYSLARDIILQNPEHIVLLDCPCRMARKSPCLPVDVCLIIGEPFASFTLEHLPQHSRAISSNEAEAVIEAAHKRGHVTHAFFKDAMLGRFYAICNCCSCCCGAMQAQRNGTRMLCSSGYVAHAEVELCTGCKKCERLCQFNAISMVNGKVSISQECMGCGVCVTACKSGALRLELAPEKGAPLEITALAAERGLDLEE